MAPLTWPSSLPEGSVSDEKWRPKSERGQSVPPHSGMSDCQPSQVCGLSLWRKQHQRPAPAKTVTAIKDRTGVLKAENLAPGQQVSFDHFICGTKGRLFSSAGKSLNSEMFAGGCLFIDHATNFVHVEFQKHLNSTETMKAKGKFEALARDHGVIPQSYLSDNAGCFTSAQFNERLSSFKQVIKFAGVGAHQRAC